ncbi:MAG TPA: SRPBCC family protein [Methylomirabilota bacterium]|nr:SRPBCC family protein [Methylomirabilota bacterium]
MDSARTSGARSHRGEQTDAPDHEMWGSGLGGRTVDHRGRELALMAVAAGLGVLWIWSKGPRRRVSPKRRPDMPTLAAGRGLHVERTMTVRRSADDVYQAWRDLERLPRLLPEHLVSVTALGPGQSRWVMTGPGGVTMIWEAELTADEPGRLLAWRSDPGADLDVAGSVRFTPAPGERGTEIKVILTYAPPGRKVGAAVAALLGQGGDRLVREALRRFKQVMETGEISVAARSREARQEGYGTDPDLARSA